MREAEQALAVRDLDQTVVLELLSEIADAREYVPGGYARESTQAKALRAMVREKLIKWCPYPEEFYVLLPEGRRLRAAYLAGASPTTGRVDLAALDGAPEVVGSVHHIYRVKYAGEPHLLFKALDAGSVFDVGTFFSIPGSGPARNALRHLVFTRLQDPVCWQQLTPADFARCFQDADKARGLRDGPISRAMAETGARTHHVGLVAPGTGEVLTTVTDVESDLALVREYPVMRPVRTQLLGVPVYDYRRYTEAPSRVLALEHAIRLGVPSGSYVADRYAKLFDPQRPEAAAAFLASYGVDPPLQVWGRLPNPSCDWATKYEDHDRYLTVQEALHISGLPATELAAVVDLLVLCTVSVDTLFRQAGLTLWDLKWEVAFDEGGPVIVDTLDHDSIRLTKAVEWHGVTCHVHFNKQAIRDYYRILHRDWHHALGNAKELSARKGSTGSFKELYHEGVARGRYPAIPALDAAFAQLQSEKYRYVNDACHGNRFAAEGEELARRELEYYAKRGAMDAFLSRNAGA